MSRTRSDAELRVYVYLMALQDSVGAPICPIKVGIAADPHKRLRQLSTANPYRIQLVDYWEMPDREYAALLELKFHNMHRDRRMNGEWFDMPAWLAQYHIEFIIGYVLGTHFGWEEVSDRSPFGELDNQVQWAWKI